MCKGEARRHLNSWRWWLVLLVVGISIGVSSLNSQADDTLPFPDASVGSYIFGVGSYYNAFAAGKLTINSGPIDTLEGRYAANQMVLTSDTANDSKVWNKLTNLSPVYVANEVPIDDPQLKTQAENLFKVFNWPGKLPAEDKVVVNNLRNLAQNQWSETEKKDNQTLIDRLAPENVGDVTYFKDNAASLTAAYGKELDPKKVDASDYFKAAAAQIKKISDYYAAFNEHNSVISNAQVTSVQTADGKNSLDSSSPTITINLADNYQKNFSDEPPMIFIRLSGQPQNVTVKVRNMDTTTGENAVSADDYYATYKNAPYIFLNWTGITHDLPFSWGSAYHFEVQDQDGKVITNTQNDDVTNSDGTKATVNQLLSSHILNNFPNAVTNGDDDYLTADRGNAGDPFTGSVMVPQASFKISNIGPTQYFYGSVISGKNVFIENNMLPARVMASSFDVQHISSDNVTQLDPNREHLPELKDVTLTSPQAGDEPQVVQGGTTSAYTHPQKDGPVTLSAKVTTQKTDYQLFYQLNGQVWHTIAKPTGKDTASATNDLTLGNLLNLTDANQDQLTAGTLQSQAATFDPSTTTAATQAIGKTLQRVNDLKLVVTPVKNKAGEVITTANVAEQLGTYSPTTVTVKETGALTATVPTTFDLKRAGSDYTASPTVKVTNDWQVPVSLTLGSATQLTGPLKDGALPVQLTRPLSFQATLDGVTTQHTLSDPATTILSQTSPATTAKDIALSFTLATTATGATQPGKTYYVPLNWHLNYGFKDNKTNNLEE